MDVAKCSRYPECRLTTKSSIDVPESLRKLRDLKVPVEQCRPASHETVDRERVLIERRDVVSDSLVVGRICKQVALRVQDQDREWQVAQDRGERSEDNNLRTAGD
jgi:hypothetical protein